MLEGPFEQGQMAIVLDAAKLFFHRPQRGRTPAQLLIARRPACHPPRFCREPRHHALDQVRRRKAHAKFDEDVQAVERERFLEAFQQTLRGAAATVRRWCFVCVRRTLAMGGIFGNEWTSLAGFTL